MKRTSTTSASSQSCRRHARVLGLGIFVAGLVVAGTACSTGSPSGVISTTTTSSSTIPSSTTSSSTPTLAPAVSTTTSMSSPAALGAPGGNHGGGAAGTGPITVAYAQCMRDHGVSNYPNPVDGAVSNLIGLGISPTSPQFQAALKACQAGG